MALSHTLQKQITLPISPSTSDSARESLKCWHHLFRYTCKCICEIRFYMATFKCGFFSNHRNHMGHRKGWQRRTGFANFLFKFCMSPVVYTQEGFMHPYGIYLTTSMWASHRQAKWLARDHTGSQMQSTKTEHNNSQARPLAITALISF